MTPITRFAPSPTGQLHLGHAYSAMRAHDFARSRGGRFLLRIEDIDIGRCREAFVDDILRDLEWLGLKWDGAVIRQSQRLPVYADALRLLQNMGLVYPCFCTRKDIAPSASAPHGPEGPVYPGTCRALKEDQRALRMASDPHCWRIDIATAAEKAGALTWHDSHRGEVVADPVSHGDVVLARKDAPVAYHLAVTIDDATLGITDVVRGEDLFEATHVHRLLQALLGLPTPEYHHHALLKGADGQRLAKRNGAPTLAAKQAAGADPAALLAALRATEGGIGSPLLSA